MAGATSRDASKRSTWRSPREEALAAGLRVRSVLRHFDRARRLAWARLVGSSRCVHGSLVAMGRGCDRAQSALGRRALVLMAHVHRAVDREAAPQVSARLLRVLR